MDVLIRFGFTIDEIKDMMDTNTSIDSILDKEIYELISILEKIGCNRDVIRNIFICNPFYITRSVNEVNDLIKKLLEIGFTNLDLLFDTNPYILNMTDEDVSKLYDKMSTEGLEKDEIINYINYNIIY